MPIFAVKALVRPLVAGVILVALLGCSAGQPVDTIVSVTITDGDILVPVGNVQSLTVVVVTNGAADDSVTWSSDQDAVASIDASGLLTALAEGTATITATSVENPTKYDSILVMVVDLGGSVTVFPVFATLLPGATMEFYAETYLLSDEGVSWSATGGDLTTAGNFVTYTAPDDPGAFELTATSTVRPDLAGTAAIGVVVTDHAPLCTDPGVAVTIPDDALRTLIVGELGLAGGGATCAEMLGLTVLVATPGASVHDLEGLQHAINLTELDLEDNYVMRLTPLAGLTELQTLNLGTNGYLTDISPLAGLTNLIDLDLSGDQIVDLTALAGLTSLVYLGVSSNHGIEDIGPLAGLTELTVLDVGSNLIEEIGPLANLIELEVLVLQFNRVEDISALANLTKLGGMLRLTDNLISDIAPLVANAGLGAGVTIMLDANCLDLTAGSPAVTAIEALTGRGVQVFAFGQKLECFPV